MATACCHLTALTALTAQRQQTIDLIQQRQAAFTARHGTPMGADHIWLAQRTRRSLPST